MAVPRDPSFLEVEDVIVLHDDKLRSFGGSAGIRDANALVAGSEND